jgi:hypothetical protein
MTVQELIEMLSELDPFAEVRLATQPSWPLEYELTGLLAQDPAEQVVYLVQGGQLGYLPGDIATQLDWRG